jgi:hypothetical protein
VVEDGTSIRQVFVEGSARDGNPFRRRVEGEVHNDGSRIRLGTWCEQDFHYTLVSKKADPPKSRCGLL